MPYNFMCFRFCFTVNHSLLFCAVAGASEGFVKQTPFCIARVLKSKANMGSECSFVERKSTGGCAQGALRVGSS